MNSHLSQSAWLILNFRTLPLFHLVSKGIFDFNCVWISNWRSPTRKYAKIHPSIHKEVYGHRDQYVSSTNQKVVPARCLHFLGFSLNAQNSWRRTQIEWYQESARLKINLMLMLHLVLKHVLLYAYMWLVIVTSFARSWWRILVSLL